MVHRRVSRLASLGLVLAMGAAGSFVPPVAMSAPEAEAQESDAQVSVTELEVNYLSEPMGIDDGQPFFGWLTESNVIGAKQHSYRVEVAADRDFSDIVWDSGT